MRTINKIVESKEEPNTNDLWLNDNKLLVYKEGEWKQLGGGSLEPYSIIDGKQSLINSEELVFYKSTEDRNLAYAVLKNLPPRMILLIYNHTIVGVTVGEDLNFERFFLVPGIATDKSVAGSTTNITPQFISQDLIPQVAIDMSVKYLGTSSINSSHTEVSFYPILVEIDLDV